MKSLAKGTSSDCIFKLIKVMINTQQDIFAEALQNTDAIEDIADKLETSKQLFENEENCKGTFLNKGVYDKDEIEDKNYKIPEYVEEQIHSTKVLHKEDLTDETLAKTYTGPRSA